MQRRTLLSLPIAAALLPGCARSHRQNEVFAAFMHAIDPLLEGLPVGPQDQAKVLPTAPGSIRLVLRSRVVPGSPSLLDWRDVASLTKELNGLQPSAAEDLLRQKDAATPIKLPPSLVPRTFRLDYLAVGEPRPQMADADDASRANDKFPGAMALLTFSPVGFSLDGGQAVFSVDFTCATFCGTGYGVVMHRTPAGWVPEQVKPIWFV